jgi:hypothetical protein
VSTTTTRPTVVRWGGSVRRAPNRISNSWRAYVRNDLPSKTPIHGKVLHVYGDYGGIAPQFGHPHEAGVCQRDFAPVVGADNSSEVGRLITSSRRPGAGSGSRRVRGGGARPVGQ